MTKIRISPSLANDFIDYYDDCLCSLGYFLILVREEFGYPDDRAAFDHAKRLVVGMLEIGWARIVLSHRGDGTTEVENPIEVLNDYEAWMKEIDYRGPSSEYTIIMTEIGHKNMVRIAGLD